MATVKPFVSSPRAHRIRAFRSLAETKGGAYAMARAWLATLSHICQTLTRDPSLIQAQLARGASLGEFTRS